MGTPMLPRLLDVALGGLVMRRPALAMWAAEAAARREAEGAARTRAQAAEQAAADTATRLAQLQGREAALLRDEAALLSADQSATTKARHEDLMAQLGRARQERFELQFPGSNYRIPG